MMVSRQMVEDQHYDPVIYWYRYEDYYGEDAYEPCIQIARFRVIKKTPKVYGLIIGEATGGLATNRASASPILPRNWHMSRF